MNILGIIPARYGSTRFPAKALADIGGKSMIRRVYEQATKSALLSDVVIATDHEAIMQEAASFGGKACMTSENHQSGTDRCYEALTIQDKDYDYVINIQGDEPFINPSQIDLLAGLLDGNTQLGTLVKQIEDQEELFNPNVVKAIFNVNNDAIYFSRATLPYNRNSKKEDWLQERKYFKHIGIYAYRSDILKQITNLPVSGLEYAESLEQLRWIENGYVIKVAETEYASVGVDTPEDLEKLKNFY
ncbi:3-deoxy-manno-octulosonate cytidylyltransferase [Fulvivirga kasyanovii]|uniref:3-deoxy-manno-octulosonate cytidylyltransferase n=1 Tax=Fulvivirga kasyanovii TaxID=396812 RepID=A0ABW9RM85_9BACT|nr:3-deoxy-manno-octulosonate cytidylyltransferase [Fulvivirga kasyanovii]MTI24290.1 3-deoxy-manno-octulosonate cytidylyltransferase [Fulvivirga kasyanovii]